MEVTFGLISALCWGITDFLGGPAARRVGVKHAVFTTNAIGLAALLLIFASSETARNKALSGGLHGVVGALAAAALLLCATLTLTTALRAGKAAIVAPIAMSYGIVTTILSLTTGEHVHGLQLIGIVICILGVPLTGMVHESKEERNEHQDTPRKSAALATLAMICFGSSYWVQGRFAIPALGSAGSLLINYAFATCILGMALLTRTLWDNTTEPPAVRYHIVVAQAAFSLLALGVFSVGLAAGHTSTMAVLSTLSGAVTAVLGFAFRGERLNLLQWAGVVIVVLGASVVRW